MREEDGGLHTVKTPVDQFQDIEMSLMAVGVYD